MRLDKIISEKFHISREKAQEWILDGKITYLGKIARKPSLNIIDQESLSILEGAEDQFVSRSGHKLEKALHFFKIDVNKSLAADVGASTGGFTHCLLQRGASRVYAIDVGHGQLSDRLKDDQRIVLQEGINAKFPILLPEKVDIVVADVSFISLRLIIDNIRALLKEDSGKMVLLFKPQFEVGKKNISKKGLVKDQIVHRQALLDFSQFVRARDLAIIGIIRSPIKGKGGNQEYLFFIKERKENIQRG